MKRSIAALLIAITTASVAWAGGTDRESFQKVLSKSAAENYSKAKMPCVGWEPAFPQRAGLLKHWVSSSQIKVACLLPVFDAFGSEVNVQWCHDYGMLR